MINEVRNAVMAVINKNNYGYISPSDFNLFAEQAQLDIFEDYSDSCYRLLFVHFPPLSHFLWI